MLQTGQAYPQGELLTAMHQQCGSSPVPHDLLGHSHYVFVHVSYLYIMCMFTCFLHKATLYLYMFLAFALCACSYMFLAFTLCACSYMFLAFSYIMCMFVMILAFTLCACRTCFLHLHLYVHVCTCFLHLDYVHVRHVSCIYIMCMFCSRCCDHIHVLYTPFRIDMNMIV